MKIRLSFVLIAFTIPFATQADIGFKGWGLRAGLSVDPDQVHAGVHVNLGEFVPNLRFQPNAEVGFGDNVILLMINGQTFYLFDIPDSNYRPYAGGELSLAYWEVDTPKGNHGDLEVGLSPVGGIELQFSQRFTGFVELKLGIGDVPDFRATIGIHLR